MRIERQSHPESAPGDFYVIEGDCLSCGAPHEAAPDLIGWAGSAGNHCIWRKQPGSPNELEQAILVLESQDLDCHRYSGQDPKVLARIPRELCDFPNSSKIGDEAH